MTIQDALWKKEYTIIDLFEKIAERTNPEIVYEVVSKNSRVHTRAEVDSEVLPLMEECLTEMEVEWNG